MPHDFLSSWMLDLNWSRRSSLCAKQLNRDSECCSVWTVLITAPVFFRVGFSCWNYFVWSQLSSNEKLISWWMIKSSWIVGLHIIHISYWMCRLVFGRDAAQHNAMCWTT
jgi:hypothetical protein